MRSPIAASGRAAATRTRPDSGWLDAGPGCSVDMNSLWCLGTACVAERNEGTYATEGEPAHAPHWSTPQRRGGVSPWASVACGSAMRGGGGGSRPMSAALPVDWRGEPPLARSGAGSDGC